MEQQDYLIDIPRPMLKPDDKPKRLPNLYTKGHNCSTKQLAIAIRQDIGLKFW